MLYENTEQGLIQVNLGYLSDKLQCPLDIGPMEKDGQGRWVVPISTPQGLPSDLAPEQFEEELRELARRLGEEHQLAVEFVVPSG